MEGMSLMLMDGTPARGAASTRGCSRCTVCTAAFEQDHSHGRRRVVCYRAACERELKREQNRATDRRRRLRLYGTPPGDDACPVCFYEYWRCRCARDGHRT